jgi:eukaryotic-like serine/threonine-protein kinase
MRLDSGTRVGPYEIVTPLGAGGMGEVYRARDARLGRDVALKVLPLSFSADRDRLARFRREAQLLAALSHANIAHVYGLEETSPIETLSDDTRALVLELVEGPTLAERLSQGPLPLDEALPIARQIAEAVEYAHEQSIMHRDLKPANIKLRPDGVVKVLDFGLAKALDPAASVPPGDTMNSPTITTPLSESGLILGTAAYMSPEQARGRPVDKRADIWAFGVILFEMLSGRRLFGGATPSEILAAVIKDEVPWHALPGSTPRAMRTLLGRCLERDPRERLRDIGEARVLLERWPESDESAAPHPSPARSSSWWPVSMATLAALGIGMAALAWMGRRPVAPSAPSPLRFTMTVPSEGGMLLLPAVSTMLGMSADGQSVAWVGTTGIWLWSAATGEARPLEDTEGALAPFFSPDGSQLAFFANNELRRLSVAGGPASLVVSAPAGSAGAWGPDDTILYNRWLGPDAGLWTVASRGGEPRLLVPAPLPTELHAFPAFLPDGRHYAFLRGAYGGRVGERQICIASLDDPTPDCIAPGDSNVVYSGSGHLVFVRRGALVALPFDPRTRRPTSEAITLTRDANWFGPTGVSAFGVSADGRVLVVAPAPGRARLAWFDRGGRELGRLGDPGRLGSFQLSPDGRRVAVEIWNDDTGGRDLWSVDAASGVASRLTFDPIDAFSSIWSPDGRRLAYSRPNPGPPDIAVHSLEGGDTRIVLSAPGVQVAGHWSPGGKEIAYVDFAPERREQRQVWLASLDGSTRRFRQTPSNQDDPRFSPDGRQLAYASDESGRLEVYVARLDAGGQPRRLSREGGVLPRWSRNGRELLFLQPNGLLLSVDPAAEGATPQALFHIGRAPATTLAAGGIRESHYDVTPDGQRFLVRVLDGPHGGEGLRVAIDWAPPR